MLQCKPTSPAEVLAKGEGTLELVVEEANNKYLRNNCTVGVVVCLNKLLVSFPRKLTTQNPGKAQTELS